MARGHGAAMEGDRAPVTLWSILEDLGKPKGAAAPGTLGERSLPEPGSPCPAPAVLGAEGISSGAFPPSIPQNMEGLGWAWFLGGRGKMRVVRWVEISVWVALAFTHPAAAEAQGHSLCLMAWEIWGEHPWSTAMLCCLCPPHCRGRSR